MTEQTRDNLKKIYRIYNAVDWIIAILIFGTPVALILFESFRQGDGVSGITSEMAENVVETFMYSIGNLPMAIIIPLFIVYTLYTVFCIVLYVKVWPIKEIRNTATYWWDWVLTIALTAYDEFIELEFDKKEGGVYVAYKNPQISRPLDKAILYCISQWA